MGNQTVFHHGSLDVVVEYSFLNDTIHPKETDLILIEYIYKILGEEK